MANWIARPSGLNQEEMEHNANIVINTLRASGFEDRTIAGILGNMQNESSINPQREEVGGLGYGLVQWTPVDVLKTHARNIGLSDYQNGDTQMAVIPTEILGNPTSNKEWYTTKAFIENYYQSGATSDMIGITGSKFIKNEMNWSADKLAIMFMSGYERPTYNPSDNHYKKRMSDALKWYDYMGRIVPPTPLARKSNKFIPIILLARKRGIF